MSKVSKVTDEFDKNVRVVKTMSRSSHWRSHPVADPGFANDLQRRAPHARVSRRRMAPRGWGAGRGFHSFIHSYSFNVP